MCKSLPKYLYKYRAITDFDRNLQSDLGFTRKLLVNGELYFSRFSELADPNEAIFSYAEDSDIAVSQKELPNYEDQQIIKQLPDGRYHLRVNGAVAGWHVRNSLDQGWGVYCLTEDEKNLLMFDYYAGGHHGICIKMDWSKIGILVRETKEIQQPTKIQYLRKPPLVSSDKASSFDGIFISKWHEYKHEKEWRFFNTPGALRSKSGEILNKRDLIVGIIFGSATTSADKELVKEWLKDRSDMEYYQSKLSKGQYKLEIFRI